MGIDDKLVFLESRVKQRQYSGRTTDPKNLLYCLTLFLVKTIQILLQIRPQTLLFLYLILFQVPSVEFLKWNAEI